MFIANKCLLNLESIYMCCSECVFVCICFCITYIHFFTFTAIYVIVQSYCTSALLTFIMSTFQPYLYIYLILCCPT